MPRNNTSPRRQRTSSDNEGGIDLSVAAERTIGNFGGIRADASVEVGIDGILRNNRLSGSYDPIERTASFDAGLGSRQAKLGGEIGGEITLKENGSIESIGGKAGISFGGFGGGISASSSGSGAISAEAFGGKIEVARDDKGNVSMSICYGIGIASMCSNFSRDTGDPQNTGSLRPTISARPGSNRPNRPATPNTEPPPRRKKPEPKKPTSESTSTPEKPNPNPRPKPAPKPKPTTPKKPTLNPEPKKKPPVDIRRKSPIDLKKKPAIDLKKPPVDIRKKPAIDLKKKSPIDLKKKSPIDLRKKPAIDLKKKSPIDLKKKSPVDIKPIIDLRKPPPPKPPKPPKPARPTPTPKPTPKPKRPTPTPKPTPVPKPKRPSPWPVPTPPAPTPPTPIPPGSPLPKPPMPGPEPMPTLPVGTKNFCKVVISRWNRRYSWRGDYVGSPPYQFGDVIDDYNSTVSASYDEKGILTGTVDYKVDFRHLNLVEPNPGKYNYERRFQYTYNIPRDPYPNRVNAYYNSVIEVRSIGGEAREIKGNEQAIYDYLKNSVYSTSGGRFEPSGYWAFFEYRYSSSFAIVASTCVLPPKKIPPRLPNNPPKIKPMKDCCDKIEDMYKYFGIAKIKKNKFKVAKAFMVPGGEGNEECEDYYAVNQALFRMLANGLIINPTSKPLGSDWKSVNATAWAGNVYEMVAEAMSNGNSSQKYEISMMMQITQLLSIVSELTRKVEFLSEVLGTEPDLDIEEIPACFTIYEGHKGFEKKEPKKIDIAKPKTDDEVEATLGKMLRPSKIPITKWVLKPESKSIVQIMLDQ